MKAVEVPGVAHRTLKVEEALNEHDVQTTLPANLYSLLEETDAFPEYTRLMELVASAQRGTVGNWKGSSIARALYLGGVVDAFKKKSIDLYFTSRSPTEWNKPKTVFKLFFVNRRVNPKYVPTDIYTDGITVHRTDSD